MDKKIDIEEFNNFLDYIIQNCDNYMSLLNDGYIINNVPNSIFINNLNNVSLFAGRLKENTNGIY